jgi:phosphotriesterase-related protein
LPDVTTVLGPVAPEDLGITTPHEHLLVDTRGPYWALPEDPALQAFALEPVGLENLGLVRRNFVSSRDNLVLDDADLAAAELAQFAALGGRTLVELTLPEIGRDVRALAEISRRTGVNVIAGCGHYVHLAHPDSLADEPLESIAERIERDVVEGVDGTGIRAGIIGEIGTSHPLHPHEEKVLRAAARAQARTGVALTIHLHPPSRAADEVLAVLDDEGTDLERVVLGHCDIQLGHLDATRAEVVEQHIALALRGPYVEYDTCGFPDAYMPDVGFYHAFWFPSDRDRAEAIARLFDAGVGDRVLIGQDVCHKFHLTRYGGYGYGHILRSFRTSLRDYGLGDAELQALLVDNPRRMLTPT